MLSFLKRIWRRAMAMCPAAYIVLKGALIAACLLLCASLVCRVCFESGGAALARHLSRELLQMPSGLLLLAVIVSACLEEVFGEEG